MSLHLIGKLSVCLSLNDCVMLPIERRRRHRRCWTAQAGEEIAVILHDEVVGFAESGGIVAS